MPTSHAGKVVLAALLTALLVGFPGATRSAADDAGSSDAGESTSVEPAGTVAPPRLEFGLAALLRWHLAAPAAQGTITEGSVTEGTVTEGSVTEGVSTEGATEGTVTQRVAAGELEAASGVTAADLEPAKMALPACEYQDIPTRYGKIRHWKKTLLDTNLRVRTRYEPWDLVSVSRAGIRGSGWVRKIMIEDLRALAVAARRAGKPLAVRSAYRSYRTQVATFDSWVRRSGYEQALKFSARPGHSEHQLGTTVDFTTAPGVPLTTSFGESPAGKWLARHGWKYGFIMSYPKGKKRVSCYGYEPWHWRYFGRDMARAIHESGQVPRRYLYENVETLP